MGRGEGELLRPVSDAGVGRGAGTSNERYNLFVQCCSRQDAEAERAHSAYQEGVCERRSPLVGRMSMPSLRSCSERR